MTDAPSSPEPTPAPAFGQGQEIEVEVEVDVVEVVAAAEAPAVDLEALTQIEQDLDAVDAAIAALDAGTYGIDPATGQPIDDVLLAADPTRLS